MYGNWLESDRTCHTGRLCYEHGRDSSNSCRRCPSYEIEQRYTQGERWKLYNASRSVMAVDGGSDMGGNSVMWVPGFENIAQARLDDLKREAARNRLIRQAQGERPQRLRRAFSGLLTISGRSLVALGERLVEPSYVQGLPSDVAGRR
jgi:hypothetical protein